MKQFFIALLLGLATIAVSVFFLADRDKNYETDSQAQKVIGFNETYSGTNYNLTPLAFDCGEFSSSDKKPHTGCVLTVAFRNTTKFPQLLNLDGDKAIDSNQLSYKSSDELSRAVIKNNALSKEIQIDELVEGGIYFDVPADIDITTVHIFDNPNDDPIVIEIK